MLSSVSQGYPSILEIPFHIPNNEFSKPMSLAPYKSFFLTEVIQTLFVCKEPIHNILIAKTLNTYILVFDSHIIQVNSMSKKSISYRCSKFMNKQEIIIYDRESTFVKPVLDT